MKRSGLIQLAVVCLSLGLCPVTSAQDEGRSPEDRFEVEGHFGFYTNLAFPNARDRKPRTIFTCPYAWCTPLHPEIRSRDVGWQGGFRASYDLTPRWAVEYGLNVTQTDNFRYDDRTRFADRPGPAPWLGLDVTVLELQPEGGRLWVHSFNGVYHLRERGRWVPYLTGGANVVSFGRGPGVVLPVEASNPFTFFFASARLSDEPFTRWGGNVGGGVKFYLRRHFGLRGDARFLFVDSKFTQLGALRGVGGGPGPPVILRFGPGVAYQQSGLYSNLHVTFGVFGRF